jgi:mannose-6-phosphate isomerase-like protein (cupin superfamily)
MERLTMKSFTHLSEIEAITRRNEHGGKCQIHFRRLWSAADFEAPIDFVDFTVVPPQSTIGLHSHYGNEEAYFVASGSPLVKVEGDQRRLSKGDVAVVRSGQSHELINDTSEDVEVLVFQVRIVESWSS